MLSKESNSRCVDCTNIGTSVCKDVCKNGSHFNRNECIDSCRQCKRYPSCGLMVRRKLAEVSNFN